MHSSPASGMFYLLSCGLWSLCLASQAPVLSAGEGTPHWQGAELSAMPSEGRDVLPARR